MVLIVPLLRIFRCICQYTLKWPDSKATLWLQSYHASKKNNTKRNTTTSHNNTSHDQNGMKRLSASFQSDADAFVVLPQDWALSLPQGISLDTAELHITQWEKRAHEREQTLNKYFVTLEDAVPCDEEEGVEVKALHAQWIQRRMQRVVGTFHPWGIPLIPALCEAEMSELYFLPSHADDTNGSSEDPTPVNFDQDCVQQNVVHPWELRDGTLVKSHKEDVLVKMWAILDVSDADVQKAQR
eukprot:PhF_6_TR3383/c0_g1_i2/m.4838